MFEFLELQGIPPLVTALAVVFSVWVLISFLMILGAVRGDHRGLDDEGSGMDENGQYPEHIRQRENEKLMQRREEFKRSRRR